MKKWFYVGTLIVVGVTVVVLYKGMSAFGGRFR